MSEKLERNLEKHLTEDNLTSLYLHWPFCISKCPYCSFNSYGVTEMIPLQEWKEAFLFALEQFAELQPDKVIHTIYFGGGTPSLLPASFIADLIQHTKSLWKLSDDVEISMEINPGTVNEDKIHQLAESGINRVSIGIQSMNNDGLIQLGRQHTVEKSITTFQICLQYFSNISLDLIYGRPGHCVDAWHDELVQILELAPQHLSLYQLTIEDDTVFGHMHRRGELLLPDDDTCADLFDITQQLTEKAGYEAYEISNHALPGYRCVHNLRYWLYQDYIGIGPGAHSRVTMSSNVGSGTEKNKYAIVQELNPKRWLKFISNNHALPEERNRLTLEEQTREALLVGIRMKDGIDVSRLPLPLEKSVEMDVLDRLVQEGYLTYDGRILKGTDEGRKRMDAITLLLVKFE